MMKLQTYAGFSFLATISAIYYAFSSRGQFYPAMVYLSTSKICFVLLLNTGLVIMLILWQLVKKIFLGTLREAEIERLNEQSWREIVEILFAVTIFRQDFSVTFLSMVTALLLIKALHWLAQKRVEYIETTPSVSTLSHLRIVSFIVFLFAVDCAFLWSNVGALLRTRTASVAIFFAFEYTILATTTVSTFVKYIFYISDMIMEGQWEKKAVYTFYLELVSDLLHLSLYMLFFIVVFLNYGVPLHLIRELYETFRNFRIRVSDYIRYRKLTSNMNERFPDATPEELDMGDATCIICREEMTTAKKLICGHLFHVQCLRSWLERQHTCPTCRSPIIPTESASSASQQAAPAQPQPTVTGGTNQSTGGEQVSPRERMLGVADSALALIGKSSCTSRPAIKPKTNTQEPGTSSSSSQQAAPTFPVHHAPGPNTYYNSDQTFPVHHAPGPSIYYNSDQHITRLRAEESLLQTRIKMLQTELQVLEQQKRINQGGRRMNM
ncbi:hypothetical protein LUZ60_000090 [Juncus effusus]|nr:hypothetical protein LUZ60_000090 [Juncus effusus]